MDELKRDDQLYAARIAAATGKPVVLLGRDHNEKGLFWWLKFGSGAPGKIKVINCSESTYKFPKPDLS